MEAMLTHPPASCASPSQACSAEGERALFPINLELEANLSVPSTGWEEEEEEAKPLATLGAGSAVS